MNNTAYPNATGLRMTIRSMQSQSEYPAGSVAENQPYVRNGSAEGTPGASRARLRGRAQRFAHLLLSRIKRRLGEAGADDGKHVENQRPRGGIWEKGGGPRMEVMDASRRGLPTALPAPVHPVRTCPCHCSAGPSLLPSQPPSFPITPVPPSSALHPPHRPLPHPPWTPSTSPEMGRPNLTTR